MDSILGMLHCTAHIIWDERGDSTAKDWMAVRLDRQFDRMTLLVTVKESSRLKDDDPSADSSGMRARMQMRMTGGQCDWQSDTTPSYTGSTPL